jgi:CheY-like chemotaxis protein
MLANGVTGHRILIVEDEPLIAMMIEDMVVDLGHSVSATARDNAEATAAVGEGRSDIALLDVNLGGGTSLAVAELCFVRNLPVVFTTGYSRSDLPAICQDRPVLSKPFTIDDLRRVLSEVAPPPSSPAAPKVFLAQL